MTVQARVSAALEEAWDLQGAARDFPLPEEVKGAVEVILSGDSAPNRQILITIAAGTAEDGTSNPASLQLAAGVDRRSQARGSRDALAAFRGDHGLVLKVTQDAGVSNQWRETQIDAEWVGRRRGQYRVQAQAFLNIVDWLATQEPRDQAAQVLLEYTIERVIARAVSDVLRYPIFRADPRLARTLVKEFLAAAADRPDALEAIAVAVCRSIAPSLFGEIQVIRGDVNSPDAIDLVIERDGAPTAGIEVTDAPLTLAKLELEVLPAMQLLGLGQVTVLATSVEPAQVSAIEEWQSRMLVAFGQRVDIVDVEQILDWVSIPLLAEGAASQLLHELGAELDALGKSENRHEWHAVLTRYVETVLSQT